MTSTLAQKMREGIAISKPTQRVYIADDRDRGGEIYACALGAAMLACGIGENYRALELCTKTDLGRFLQSPVTAHTETLAWIIIGLNDHYGWPREKIVDWVEEVTRDW